MIIYLLLTVSVLLIALTVKSKQKLTPALVREDYNYVYRGITRSQLKSRMGLLAIFVLLTGISAIRLNVGNDYSKYVEIMHRAYSDAIVPTEWGFNTLTKLVYRFSGFENYVAVFAIFAAVTVALFLGEIYRQSEDFWMSFMMFMLLGYYFQSISTVRYYLALGAALMAMRFCLKGDWPAFVMVVLLGSLFHKSLLVILVLYPLAAYRWKRWMYGAFGVLCISTLFLKDIYLKIAIKIYPSYEGTEYLSGGTSKVSILRCLAVMVFAIYVLGKDVFSDKRMRFYFMCNFGAFALYVFCSFLPTVSRIAYYLTVTQILFVPALLLRMKEDIRSRVNMKLLAKIAVIAFCALYFVMYMRRAADDGVRVLPYETIFFHELPATLSERGFG